MNKKNSNISARIKKALLILSFGLSAVFALLIFLLLYIIEDQVFINLLHAEQVHYQQLDHSNAQNWKPSNRYMRFIENKEHLPKKLQNIVSDKLGVYEFFKDGKAYFILHDQKKNSIDKTIENYYITFDVTELLAVKKGRYSLITAILFVTLCVMLIAMYFSIRLSRNILTPLKQLSAQLQKHGFDELPKGFSKPFAGDEIGVLATQLEKAIEQAQSATQREFEFNTGVSHELRTPIQVALNSVELIELTQHDLKNNKTVKRLKRSIIQMEQISEAFLWLASQRSLENISSNPFSIIESLKQNYQQQYPNQSLIVNNAMDKIIEYNVPPPVFTVIIDNLIRNAFQHGSDGDVFVDLNNDSFEISNTKLAGTHTSNNSNKKGYGIGLMIVKRICQRLDWQINQIDSGENHFKTVIRNTTQLI